jgi:hypothetical protein
MSTRQRGFRERIVTIEIIQGVFFLIAGLLVAAGAYFALTEAGISIELTAMFAASVVFGAMAVGAALIASRKKPRRAPEVEFHR